MQEPRAASRFWSGNSFGLDGLADLRADSDPRLVVVVGSEDAGKTCLLTAQYLCVSNGGDAVFPYRFAGSHTLRGFENLARANWNWDGAVPTNIPARTTQQDARTAGFYHLAFKPSLDDNRCTVSNSVRHIVLSDMPGEWFDRWSQDANDTARMPFLPSSYAFWVVVDLPALSSNRKAARRACALLGRVVDYAAGVRPVSLLLCKSDRLETVPVDDACWEPAAWGAEQSVMKRLLHLLDADNSLHRVVAVSSLPTAPADGRTRGVLLPLQHVLERRTPALHAEVVPTEKSRFFQYFRSRSHGK